MFDFADIKIFENSTKYDWSLLPDSKFVLEFGLKRKWLPNQHIIRMFDANLRSKENGWIIPVDVKRRLTLKGVNKGVTCNEGNLLYFNYHLRSTLNPISTQGLMKNLIDELIDN